VGDNGTVSFYEDEQPELVGYIPSDGRPLRSRRMLVGMRIVVAVGVAGLVLPGVIGTVMINAKDAAESCKRWVTYEYPNDSSAVSFELMGAHGSGWQCYTQSNSFGGSQFVASLGWIPGPPQLPTGKYIPA
jgi:hypothetical protein